MVSHKIRWNLLKTTSILFLELARGDWYLISKYFVGMPTWNLNINLHNLSSKTFVCMVVVVFSIMSGHGWAMYSINPTKASSWWWFQRFFIFTPTWQDDPIWRAYFSDGLVQPPTSHRILGLPFPLFGLRWIWGLDFSPWLPGAGFCGSYPKGLGRSTTLSGGRVTNVTGWWYNRCTLEFWSLRVPFFCCFVFVSWWAQTVPQSA